MGDAFSRNEGGWENPKGGLSSSLPNNLTLHDKILLAGLVAVANMNDIDAFTQANTDALQPYLDTIKNVPNGDLDALKGILKDKVTELYRKAANAYHTADVDTVWLLISQLNISLDNINHLTDEERHELLEMVKLRLDNTIKGIDYGLGSPRESVQWFSLEMEKQLRANDHKGGWQDCNRNWLAKQARKHISNAEAMLDREATEDEIIAACAHAANFLHMIADLARDGDVNG